MRMVKCKKCGNEYPCKMKKCPECKTRTPISAGRKILAIFLSLIVVLIAVVAIADVGGDIEPTQQSSSSQTEAVQNSDNTSKSNDEKMIYSDADLKVSFIKVSDGAKLGVTACYIHLKVENLGSQTVNVSLTDAYANDTAVTVMSGVPMKLAPGKNSKQPFLFGYNEIFTSADEVEKLEFKVTLYDENYTSIVKTTESIIVNVE